ncbi:MAG: hypothetical protein E6Q97_27425 [Desulfurellales bacterium]|nr:MAG: hypothetical protein E6Q97_27425 [Desulfurellales bacterium]
MPSEITPITQLGNRIPEHGRIRMGVKTEKAMKSLETFRFTSYDRSAIEQLASIHGGTVKEWIDPKANPSRQWEVISETDVIDIWLPPDAVSVWYELWSGGGIQRRCDGEVLQTTDSDGEPRTQACICAVRNQLACKVTTRINVVLPSIPFVGYWRLSSKGWNAAHEIPSMEAFIQSMQERNLSRCQLAMVQRETIINGRKKNYVVPQLRATSSPEQMLAGGGRVLAISAGPTADSPLEIDGGEHDVSTAIIEEDEDVVDAEIIPLRQPSQQLRYARKVDAIRAGHPQSMIVKDGLDEERPWVVLGGEEDD